MRRTSLLLAAILLAAPAHAIAQVNEPAVVYSDNGEDREDDGNSRLGLLGLLGLAGLLGLLKREPDIHVDARRDKRP